MGDSKREGTHGIPRVSRWLLARCLHDDDRRFALADLEEEFDEAVAASGLRRARAQYRRQVFASLGPALRGRFGRTGSNTLTRTPDSILRAVLADVRTSVRGYARTPLVLVVTVLSLGVGIGASSLAFALFRSVVYPSPVGLEAPEQLVTLYRGTPDGERHGHQAWADLDALREGIPQLVDVAGASMINASVEGPLGRQTLLGEEVTPNYFDLTGIHAAAGRVFSPEEIRSGDPRVAVLGYDAWQRVFGGSVDAVGQVVRLAGLSFTIIGVAPEGVRSRLIPFPTDVWVPVGSLSAGGVINEERRDPSSRGFLTLGRLRTGATIVQAQSSASRTAEALHDERPVLWTDDAGRAQPITVVSEAGSRVRPELRAGGSLIGAFFLLAAGLVLAVACSNVAGLFIARARKRRAELALRRSLGATRGRLIRMMLAEGVVPGTLAGILGVSIAYLGTEAIGALTLPVDVPLRLDADVDGLVLAVTFLTTVAAGLAFSIAPALEGARVDLYAALKSARGTGGGRRSRFRIKDGLVVAQCAATATLLFGAALFFRTLDVATDVDLGFDPDGIAVASRDISTRELSDREGVQFVRRLRDRMASLPEVRAAAISRSLELTLYQMGTSVSVAAGVEPASDQLAEAWRNAVTPGYIEMMDIPVIAGRALLESDDEDAESVAVVNETFVERHWPGEDPLDRVFSVRVGEAYVAYRVVGVVADGTYRDFDDPPTPFVFTSLYQDFTPRFAIALEGSTAEAVLPLLRSEIDLDEGEVQMVGPSVLADQVSFQFMHLRIASTVLGWGGIFGLLLAAMGLYGVVAFAVAQRAREMALRIALGAERLDVTRAVAREGLTLAAIGVVVGVVFVVWVARFGQGILFGVRPTDPVALIGTLGVLFAVTLTATLVPARQILRVDPMATLGRE
ncbi:MAG: ADOP family duplicated permease [Gemmatimonadota bacterium]